MNEPGDTPPAGWYPDPAGGSGMRWWDGRAWTQEVRSDDATTVIPPSGPPRLPPTPAPVMGGPRAPEAAAAPTRSRVGLWAVAVTAVVALVVGAAVGLTVRGGEGGATGDAAATEAAGSAEVPPTRDAGSGTDDRPGPGEGRLGSSAATGSPSGEDPVGDPSEEAASADPEPVEPPPAPVDEAELVTRLESYLAALDAGDLDAAYEHVSPWLRQEPGWSRDAFTSFHEETIAGANLAWVEEASETMGVVEARVDYHLPDGEVSRELVRVTLVPDSTGGLLLDDYEVLDTRRLE